MNCSNGWSASGSPPPPFFLGARRRDFLAPLWRDIARALGPAPFDPSRPERHATRGYREGLDWEHLRQSVLAVPGYATEPVVLARLAEAHWRLHDRANAIESWFALCHLAPEVFERGIEAADFPDWALRTAWCVALEQDFEPEMTPVWFPAWMLLEEPGLAAALAPRRTDDDPSRAFDATMSLLAHPSLDGHGIELHRSLQAIHPGLAGAISGEAGAAHRACAAIGVENRVSRLRSADATLARRTRGYAECQARRIFRDLIDMPADVTITEHEVEVRFHRRAHLPIIAASGLLDEPVAVPWWNGMSLRMRV